MAIQSGSNEAGGQSLYVPQGPARGEDTYLWARLRGPFSEGQSCAWLAALVPEAGGWGIHPEVGIWLEHHSVF